MGRAARTRSPSQAGADIVFCDIAAPIDEVDYELPTPTDMQETVRAVEASGGRCVALTAKAGVVALVRSLSYEVAEHGITVKCPAALRRGHPDDP